jgi:hypothetical protein
MFVLTPQGHFAIQKPPVLHLMIHRDTAHRLINLHRLENPCHRLVRFRVPVTYAEEFLE